MDKVIATDSNMFSFQSNIKISTPTVTNIVAHTVVAAEIVRLMFLVANANTVKVAESAIPMAAIVSHVREFWTS